ncbi:MAG: hypothetical protein CL521_02830 [Actinobacteria bacterium]|nr:hypothetical protein [Actinomycetota bacterium]
MVTINAFKGLRPNQEWAEKVASLPYDVYSEAEVRDLVKQQPNSFLTVIRPEMHFSEDTTVSNAELHQKSKVQLESLISSGILSQDTQESIYIYALTLGDHRQVGLVAGVRVQEYDQDIIKKHEQTRPDKEQDRATHIDVVGANTGPVFLTYRRHDDVDTLINQQQSEMPIINFTADDGVQHQIWQVSDPEVIQAIQAGFKEVSALYIADGHHRMAAAGRVQKERQAANPHHTGNEAYNFALGVMFPSAQLNVLDYNRCVKDLNGLSSSDFMAQLKPYFEIEEKATHQDAKPDSAGKFGMYLDDQWYQLQLKDPRQFEPDPVQSLDAARLQTLILDPVLGIDNPRTNQRISFVGGIRGLEELELRCRQDSKVAFALYPTSVEQLMTVADAGKLMPPKSTWFEPKLRSGLLINPID